MNEKKLVNYIEDIPIYRDDNYRFIASVSGGEDIGYTITCNRKFFESFSNNDQKFILFHEIGHIRNGHLAMFGERAVEHEYIADEYAAERIGYEQALIALENSFDLAESEYYRREYFDRMMNLRYKISGIEI